MLSLRDFFHLPQVDPIIDRPLRSWQVAETRDRDVTMWLDLLKEPYTLVLGRSLARDYGYAAGDKITLEHSQQTVDFRIVGVLAPQGLALAEGERLAITDIATFQEFTGLYDNVDRIDLILKPETNEEDLRNLTAGLPEGDFHCPTPPRSPPPAILRPLPGPSFSSGDNARRRPGSSRRRRRRNRRRPAVAAWWRTTPFPPSAMPGPRDGGRRGRRRGSGCPS